MPTPSSEPTKTYAVGDTFTGKIQQKYKDGGLMILVPSWLLVDGYAFIAVTDLGNKPYAVGTPLRCKVVQVTQDNTGKHLLICKPAPKKATSAK